jgi:hypothetical protein
VIALSKSRRSLLPFLLLFAILLATVPSSQSSAGLASIVSESGTDDLYGLTSFVQLPPPASVVFDRILPWVNYSATRPGECAVSVRLLYASDGSPVTGASVSINGRRAEDLGYGNYALALESFLPYMAVSSEIEVQNFDPVATEEGVLMSGNAFVYIASASAAAISLALFLKRARTKLH